MKEWITGRMDNGSGGFANPQGTPKDTSRREKVEQMGGNRHKSVKAVEFFPNRLLGVGLSLH